jgi:hypothetical protein
MVMSAAVFLPDATCVKRFSDVQILKYSWRHKFQSSKEHPRILEVRVIAVAANLSLSYSTFCSIGSSKATKSILALQKSWRKTQILHAFFLAWVRWSANLSYMFWMMLITNITPVRQNLKIAPRLKKIQWNLKNREITKKWTKAKKDSLDHQLPR